jgi:chloride channel protein, CIC family
MVIEVSGNYSAAVPVMVFSLIAYFISRRFQDVPLFDMLSLQDGLILSPLDRRTARASLACRGGRHENRQQYRGRS